MTTGIKAGGTDLDSIFLPLETTKRSDVKWLSNSSNDISKRFEPYTTGTKADATNLHVEIGESFVDLSDLFQKLGVPIEQVAWTTSPQTITTVGTGGVRDTTGIRLLSDGNTEKTNVNGAWVAGIDWGSPAGSVTGGNFEVSYSSFSGDALDIKLAVSGMFYPISSTRQMTYSAGGSGGRSCSFNFTVGKIGDVGSRKTSAVTLNQEVE